MDFAWWQTRVAESRKTLVDGWLKAYELAMGDVSGFLFCEGRGIDACLG